MKKYVLILIIALFGINLLNAQDNSINNSSITFAVSNMGFNTVEGSFSKMTGTVDIDKTNINKSQIDVCIASNTVNTDNNGRDKHLKKEDFFDVEKYPAICFKSTSFKVEGNEYIVTGDLTIKEITKSISIPFQLNNKSLVANFELKRKDFNLGPNGGFMVGKTIDITVKTIL